MQAVAAVFLASAVAWAAKRLGALSRSGAWAAACVGALVFGCAGWQGAAVLFAFFLPSALLSRLGRARKRALLDTGKHGARDAWQVLANGGIAALCLAGGALAHLPALMVAGAGAFAAASADTWGTEVGTLLRGSPRSILTLRPIAAGLSGGVTMGGTLAQAAGAALVGGVAAASGLALWWVVTAAGFCGAVLDSLLGASLQLLRYCPRCERTCETDPHHCGTPTRAVRGLRWIENDAVNALATAGGAAAAYCLYVFSR